jgi:hypothetical protein
MNMSKGSLLAAVADGIQHHRYEMDQERGLFLTREKFFVGGAFRGTYFTPQGEQAMSAIAPNRFVNEGLNKLLNLLGGHVTAAALYLAPFMGDVTPAAGWTGANFTANASEFTAYSPTTRPPWTTVASTAQQLTNAAALAAATITFNTGGPYTVRGMGLLEASAKSATTGALIVASRFDDDLTGMMGGGKLALEYILNALDESDVP